MVSGCDGPELAGLARRARVDLRVKISSGSGTVISGTGQLTGDTRNICILKIFARTPDILVVAV